MTAASSPASPRLPRYGPWAVVTGASDGIGRAFAVRLAGEGFHLVLVARRADALAKLAATLEASHGIPCRIVAADLGDPAQRARVIAATRELRVGMLVSAGGFGTAGDFLANEVGAEEDLVRVNCEATVTLAHHFGRRFAEQGRGALVLFGSLVGFQGVPRTANYAASKAFVQAFAEGLAAELSPLGVEVIAVAPGPVTSGFGRRAGMKIARGTPPEVVAADALQALGRATTVRPGAMSKLLGWSLAPLPRAMRTAILARVMAGMTADRPGYVPAPQRKPG